VKIIIMKKGIVDCTSDSRTYNVQTIRDGIDGAIKIFDKEVLKLDYAEFYIRNDSRLAEYKIGDKIEVVNKKDCLKMLDYFMKNPDELLSEKYDRLIYIHVDVWNFFNDGNNCSDYICVYANRLEVSCQDDYDEDMREEFHNNIAELLGSDYAATIDKERLMSLHICVTEKCSANCGTCYINKGLGRELDRENWDKLPLAAQYAIGGGEPAEYPLITELVDYLKNDRNGYVAITTNGQSVIDFNTMPDKIAVSIDGSTKKGHMLTHATDLGIAKSTAEYYKNKGIKVCINHIVHKENIDYVEKFAKFWITKGYEVNFILFTGQNSEKVELKSTYEQLEKFKKYISFARDKRIMIDSCMAGLLNLLGGARYQCLQGLFSKYYRYGALMTCSHSVSPYPGCKVMEEYLVHFFKTLRPMVFIYEKDGTSGAHEWAFRVGLKGKIVHNVDNPLRKDTIYILTDDEEKTIRESHYVAHFRDKMLHWLYLDIVQA
jgi:MoaA/NifB/PqqE/SkfB family radical SAM enzyme